MGQGSPLHPGQRPQPLRSHPLALQWPPRDGGSAPQPAHRYGEDGRERVLNEPGAVGTRVARSYLRFGQMELFTQRGELPLLQAR